MNRSVATFVGIALIAALQTGCQTAPRSAGARAELNQKCKGAIALFKVTDPTLETTFFKSAYGYAIFPDVGKGAVGVGGAFGQGQVYEHDAIVGYASLSQGSIGLALGGQAYSELIFFQTEAALNEFKSGQFAFAAQASAVAAASGAAATADYSKGVAVFTTVSGGLMFEASIGGQQFDYESSQQALAKDKSTAGTK